MGFDVYYTNRPDRDAVRDWLSWLGYRRARLLIAGARAGWTFEEFDRWCCFAGVQGFPNVAAWEWIAARAQRRDLP